MAQHMPAGSTDNKSAAMQSKTQRRSYGALPTSACISKSTERALMEQGRGPHPTAPRGNSPNDLLDLDYADLEEQEGNMWQEEDVWQRPSSAQQRSAVNMNQSTNQRRGSLDITHGTDAALQHPPLHHTVERQHHVGPLYAQPGQTQQGRSQQDLTAQTQAQPRLQQAQQPALQSQHQQAHPQQAAEAAGDHNRAGDHMQTSGLIVVSHPSASVTGESCQVAIRQQSGASPRRPGPIQTSVGLMTLLNQQSAAEQGMVACLDQPVPLQLAPQRNADSAAAPSHTEQSDRELALRLQEEEDAVQRQRQQIVPGRLLPKSNSRKPTGTIRAFFKKA